MARVAVPIQTGAGRVGAAQVAPVALDLVNGHVLTAGADRYYFVIANTHATNTVTITAVRSACPVCGATGEPANNGSITIAALATSILGPLPVGLYGKGSPATDIYLDVTGTGTGTIKAFPVGS